MSEQTVPQWARRLGGRLASAGYEGIAIGGPSRAGGTQSAIVSYSNVDVAPCPYCHGPLVAAPQCIGRALSAAEPHEIYIVVDMPATHYALACRSCKLAFFVLRPA